MSNMIYCTSCGFPICYYEDIFNAIKNKLVNDDINNRQIDIKFYNNHYSNSTSNIDLATVWTATIWVVNQYYYFVAKRSSSGIITFQLLNGMGNTISISCYKWFIYFYQYF